MIIAIPQLFSSGMRETARELGFVTYPEFLDNFYVSKGTNAYDEFLRLLTRYKGMVRYAILPDYKYDLMERLVEWDQSINWIFPLHRKSEIEIARRLGVKWIGMPQRKAWRDYSIKWFTKLNGFKKWLLGFWDEDNPYIIRCFDGMDTVIPVYYSTKCGKIWLGWNRTFKPKVRIPTGELFKQSAINLKKEIEKILRGG